MLKIIYLKSVLLFLIIFSIKAQNPIFPAGMFIADPSAHVWKDGKIYIYGSLDEKLGQYCSHKHHVYASSDLINWDLTPNAFASQGQNDQVSYSDLILYAPDCQYKNGIYYLYYCLASDQHTEGVATSNSPLGPFMKGTEINTYGNDQIDPCVFIDDDGQAYYIWGQFSAKMAKLKPNMIEIDSTSIKNGIVTEKEHFFHEGGYLVKRKGIYYFVYAHMGRGNKPTCIGYATSKSVFGPYKYGGVIIDNAHCGTGVWNNHGSIVEFNKQWYIFYHRSTHGSATMRKTCIEPIFFNKDGSINEVEMTSQGAGKPLNALNKIEAERACVLSGNVRVVYDGIDKEYLTQMNSGDHAGYKYIDFGTGVDSIIIFSAACKNGGYLQINLDQPWGKTVGGIAIPDKGDGITYKYFSAKLEKIEGIHSLWFKFWSKDTDIMNLDYFQFK